VVDHWSATAGWWQQNFTDGVDAEYEEQIIPLAVANAVGCARVLDVGCGEGQLSRATGAIGVDPVREQLSVGRGRGGVYAQALAGALPFHDGVFDAVIACLVFEHIDDAAGAIDEVGRVLRPGGRFLFFLNHPLLQTPGSGWIDDQILEEQYWRIGPYLVEDTTMEEVDKRRVPPVRPPPLVDLREPARPGWPVHHRDARARAPARVPGPRPRVHRGRHHPPSPFPPLRKGSSELCPRMTRSKLRRTDGERFE
jgi:SAM-dependent methyltransferase